MRAVYNSPEAGELVTHSGEQVDAATSSSEMAD